MTQTEIEEYITQFPIYQYAFVNRRTSNSMTGSARSAKGVLPLRSLLVLPAGGRHC